MLALFVPDAVVGGLSDLLTAAGFSVVERTPPEGDCADLYLDFDMGQEHLTVGLQPDPRGSGWHVITFVGSSRGPLYAAVWGQLVSFGASEQWPEVS
ncbi:hypothetical protein [Tautonia plasticadhaerens]|nr:hypothetical protein [Tautonia plasticadhaerens]